MKKFPHEFQSKGWCRSGFHRTVRQLMQLNKVALTATTLYPIMQCCGQRTIIPHKLGHAYPTDNIIVLLSVCVYFDQKSILIGMF